jgi:hypothetical protein
MYQIIDNQYITNLYTYQITNKTNVDLPFGMKIKNDVGIIKFVGNMDPSP